MKESRAAIANIYLPPDELQLEAVPIAYSAYLSADFERGFGCHQIDDLPLGRKKIHTQAIEAFQLMI